MSKPESRAEHHATSNPENVRDAKHRIAWLLQHRPGRQAAISARGLSRATGYHDPGGGGIKPTTVRDCIREIRVEYDLPIVSCSRGYYVISSEGELEGFISGKWEEIATHKETLRDVVGAYNRR